MKHYQIILTLLLLLSQSILLAQPSNNDCQNAIAITVNIGGSCTYTTGTTVDATDSGVPVHPVFQSFYTSGDVWYQFNTTSTGTIVVDPPANANNVVPVFEIYEGSCASLTSVIPYSTKNIFLSPNTSYFFRVWTYDGPDDFSFCINEVVPSTNISCSTAIDIPQTMVGNCEQVQETIISPVEQLTSLCHSTSNYYQAWYKFTALTAGAEIDNTVFNAYEVYSGSCNALTSIHCSADSDVLIDLIPGDEYYIKYYRSTSSSSAFEVDFCMEPVVYPTPVDECSTAPTIIVSPFGSCSAAQQNTIPSALLNTSSAAQPTCHSGTYKDAWYPFTAPANGNLYFDWVGPASEFRFINVFENNCNTLQEVYCSTEFNTTIIGLTPGDTYYLRVGISTLQDTDRSFCLTDGLDSPSNNECSGAITATVGSPGTCADLTIDFGWSSLTDDAECTDGVTHDMWYSFTTPAVGKVTIKGSESTGKQIVIYNNNCGTLNEISCSYIGTDSIQLANLNASTTYLMKVGSLTDQANVTLCLSSTSSTPPSNDECTNATFRNLGQPIIFDTDGATNSSEPAPPCYEINSPDVWYRFNGSTFNRLKHKITAGAPRMSYAIYTGACTDLELVQCHDNIGNADRHTQIENSNTEYRMRLWHTTPQGYGTGSMAQSATTSGSLPSNDDCSSANTIMLNTNTSANVQWADSDYSFIPSCGNYNGGDVWYTFSSGSTGNMILSNLSSLSTPSFTIYSGSCGSLTEAACVSISSDTDNKGYLALSPNTTYYLQAYQPDRVSNSNFTFRLEEGPASPTNDECTTATSITLNGFECVNTTVDNTFATASVQVNPSCVSTIDRDVWYEIDLAMDAIFVEINDDNGTDIFGALYTGPCGNPALVECLPIDLVALYSNLDPSQNYYLRLFTEDGLPFDDIDICIREGVTTSPNDECVDAIAIPVYAVNACQYTDGYNLGATGYQCTGPDVWYSFVAPTTGAVNFDINNINPTSSAIIYTGTCNDLQPLYDCIGSSSVIYGLIPGDTYYYQLSSAEDQLGFYEYCISETLNLVPNDHCINPTAMTAGIDECGPNYTQDMFGSNGYGSCVSIFNNIYYSFNSGLSGKVQLSINYIANGPFGSYTGGYRILQNACFPNITCTSIVSGETTDPIFDLTPNTEYTIELNASSDAQAVFDLCINQISPPAANDLCPDALPLTISSDDNCNSAITITTEGANDDYEDCYPGSKEVFYTISPSEDANYTIITYNQSFPTQLSIYSDCNGSLIGCGTDAITLPLLSGEVYRLAVASANTQNTSTYDLCIHPVVNNANSQNVGIGVTQPLQQLQVKNAIMIGNTDVDALGSIRFNGSDFEGFGQNGWISLSGGDVLTDNLGNHTATTNIQMGGNKILGLGAPSSSQDAATKAYVDSHTDGDASATNERITSMSYDNNILTVNEGSNTKTVTISASADDLGNHIATTTLNMSDEPIENLATPTNGNDAATKAYVDGHTDGDASATNEHITSMSYSNNVLTVNEGSNSQMVTINGAADNLGNHTATTSLDMQDNIIKGLGNPTSSTDAVSKGWVEGLQQIWKINGDDDLYYDDGQVGAGTSDPEYTLDVQGTGRVIRNSTNSSIPQFRLTSTSSSNPSRLRFETDDTPENFWSMEATSTSLQGSKFELIHGGQETNTVMTINDINRIGINTTTLEDRLSIVSNAGENALRVRVGSSTKMRVLANGGISLGGNNTSVTGNNVYVANRLGIGISNPSVELDIDGRAIITGNSSGGNAQLTLEETDGGFSRLYMTNTSGKNWTFAADPDITPSLSTLNFFLDDVGNIMTLKGNNRVGINNSSPSFPLEVGTSTTNGNGAHVTPGGTWTNGSSRMFKENISTVNTALILSKIANLDIKTWEYKASNEGLHIGPIAEEFHQTFGYGNNAQYISTVDTDGVALAGIKALIDENHKLKSKNNDLEMRLERLEKMMEKMMKTEDK